MNRYRAPQPDEPLTIDAGVISAYLERMNKPGMASFVRHLGHEVQRDNLKEMRLLDRITELENKYEPRIKEKGHDPRPPAEASD